ncbi:MAG TPA: response regulator [Ramlibacter sp.]|nr:response regulator [Ramlibacter sp.]
MSSADPSEPLLLLIEDNRDTLVAAGRLLETSGFRVEIARGGQDGIAKASRLRPDVIVTDLVMPVTSGYTVCKQLREGRTTRHIPVIVYTGESSASALAPLYGLGVRLFAIKPCVPTVLGQEAHALLATRLSEVRIVTGYGETLDDLAAQVEASEELAHPNR